MDADRGLRASSRWALLAFLLLLTALWLPWWAVQLRDADGSTVESHALRPFGAGSTLAERWARWGSGGLCAAAAGVLFVRLAARSWEHEPPSWRRDGGVALGLALGAVALLPLWPGDVAPWWGGRSYALPDGGEFQVTAAPALGAWLCLAAAAALAMAGWAARPRPPTGQPAP